MGLRPLLLLLLLVSQAYAGTITIPLNDKDNKLAPASDLVHNGTRINEVDAMELAKTGVDLSELDPYTSDLFRPDVALPDQPVRVIRDLKFHSFLQAPTEFFRFVSKLGDQSFTVTASLFNHETVLRAQLLRKIGYNVPDLYYQHVQTVHFDSTAAMDAFAQKLVESTLLAKKRWIVEENRSENFLRVRGLILEPADARSVPVYWPIMEETRQRKRRIYRGLLYLYTLTDFNMPINEVSWSMGTLFNNELILAHHFSDAFTSTTLDDLKWVHRRIVALPEGELCAGLETAHYPNDIADLLCEKLKSRVNSLGRALGMGTLYRVNEQVSTGQVQRGKLVSNDYPDFVPVFWLKDVESPFRFSEVFKFFRTQIAYDTISNLLSEAQDKFLPGIDTEDAVTSIMERVRNFGRQNGHIPLKVWSTPTATGSVGGGRTIVFGKYDGNDAPIQLVDTLNVRVQVGLFNYLSIPGASNVMPTATLNAHLVRSWNHIKAMPDLTTATKQQVERILIPRLYKSLGRVLDGDPQCSLQNDAWVTEEILAGVGVWMIYYDQGKESAKNEAMRLRQQLIVGGTPSGKIILRQIKKDEMCEKEITEKRNKSIEEFMKSFAADETLTMTDSLETTAGVGVRLNDALVDKLRLQIGLEGGRAVLRSYIIRKTDKGIEITIRNQKDISTRFHQGLRFFTDLLSNSTNWINGDLHSKVYRVNFEGADDEQKKIAVNVLREVFLRNSYDVLLENYHPITMEHDARVRINTFKFFWRKTETLKMNHEVEVVVPNRETRREVPVDEVIDEWTVPMQPPTDLPEAARTRNLFSTMLMMRRGSNYHAFLNQIVNDQFSWLSTGPQEVDPGQSIKGDSFHTYHVTEGDLTPGREFNPVTKVEYGNLGWSISKPKFERLMRIHEDYLSTTTNEFTLDRSFLNQTQSIRSYNIRTTLLFYPAGTQRIVDAFITGEEGSALQALRALYGAREWDRYCQNPPSFALQSGEHLFESSRRRGQYYCVPDDIMGIMRLRKQGVPKRKQDQAIQINTMVNILMAQVPKKAFLTFIGPENFFGNTFISGWRNGDSLGYTQYGSDTVGTYHQDLGTGVFDQVAGLLGIKAFQLKGMVYTPNM